VQKITQNIIQEMVADYNMPIIRVFAWTLHKIFKTIYERIVVDDKILLRL
jgi:hypothetical protein